MDQKDQIRENVTAMHRVAAKIKADINEDSMGPPGSDNGRGADLPHLSKPKHTTSYVLFISVPEEKAPDTSAAMEWLCMSGDRANAVVLDAIEYYARFCGWVPWA